MVQILNQYEQDDMQIIEYTKDGKTVSHTVKTPIQTESTEPQEPEPTTDEKIEELKTVMQENNITQYDVLATIYEELITNKGDE